MHCWFVSPMLLPARLFTPSQSYPSAAPLVAAGSALCYGAAAYVLRGSLRIDLGLRRRRDVVRYVFLSATAAAGATIFGVACLIADHSIAWGEYKSSGLGWFLGDAIGLVGIAPFLLVHVFPHVRSWLSPTLSNCCAPQSAFHPTEIHFGGDRGSSAAKR